MITPQILTLASLSLSNKQFNQELLRKGKSKAHAIGEIGPQKHQIFEKISINTTFLSKFQYSFQ